MQNHSLSISAPSSKLYRNKLLFMLQIAMMSVLIFFSTDIYSPAMPAVGEYFSVSTNAVQLTITLYLISFALSQLIYGPLSDHFGRRPIVLLGMNIYLLGTLVCVLATHLELLYLGRFLQGLGAGAVASLNRVVVNESFSGVERVKTMSYMGGIISAALAFAPVLGGFIQAYLGWRWIFIILLIYSILATLWNIISFPETNRFIKQQALNAQQVLANYTVVFKNRRFWAHVLATGMGFSAIIAYVTINPFLLQNHLAVSPQCYGAWAMLASSGLLLGMLLNARLAHYTTPPFMIKLGLSMIASMGLVLASCGGMHLMSVTLIIAPTFFMSVGIAFIFPNAAIGALSQFTNIIGAAGALYGCTQVMLSFIASLVVALLSERSQLPMGMLMIALGGIGLVAYIVLMRDNKQ